jgi:hypothetical protein
MAKENEATVGFGILYPLDDMVQKILPCVSMTTLPINESPSSLKRAVPDYCAQFCFPLVKPMVDDLGTIRITHQLLMLGSTYPLPAFSHRSAFGG